ncbi:WD40 repeat-like protein [Cryphonectria parasitica EP155]|uniref:WD40 repeat-like protein n=1 Tax=Cryphonectria parasitica (strain ATCC 38755 / EP155) TaxID=660469 RepID=A0A9P4Y465_CRYP1|nr:WD40 repeat-like protein [Cryphonectria parasitica EP155]KAF3766321.1 WD40 repeat-like protein [Cryphonectria parasitica EP155]
MNSSDPRHFFESDAAQSNRERRDAKSKNKYGTPIALKSKIAAAALDPNSPSDSVFVAESVGSVRRINIDIDDTNMVYRGPSAPVTCVVVGGPQNETVFAGSWDKNIWSWNIETRRPGIKFVGHSDFVKAVACAKISEKHVLISGGADKKIIVWDIATGSRLHTLQDSVTSMLAVQSLAIDPIMSSGEELVVVSAGSDPHLRRWKVRLDGWEQLLDAAPAAPNVERRLLSVHETGVYKILFDRAGDEIDLWTASADGTARCLSRGKAFTTEDCLEHGDHVRAVGVTEQWIITAGRDEDLKCWDRTSGALYCALEGHYDEVTDLVVLERGKGHDERLVSVSIDGTVRVWPLGKAGLDAAVEEQSKPPTNGAETEPARVEEPNGMLTAEEEAELAELMDD